MDNLTSLEYIIENDEFIEKFATGKTKNSAFSGYHCFPIKLKWKSFINLI